MCTEGVAKKIPSCAEQQKTIHKPYCVLDSEDSDSEVFISRYGQGDLLKSTITQERAEHY